MFRRRREARANVENEGTAAVAGEGVAETALPSDEPARNGHRAVTLETPCGCGHTRRAHTGMRIEVQGRCLECACERFSDATGEQGESAQDTLARIQAAIEQVDRLIETAATLAPETREHASGARK